MRYQEKKGSAVTAIIAAMIFFLVLAIFGKSVQGERQEYSAVIKSSTVTTKPYVAGSSYYHINVLNEAEHHFIPVFQNLN